MRPRAKIGVMLALALAMVATADRAAAGPAHYDKDSKSFRLTYTFAVLPGGGNDPSLGQVQKPTNDQEATVNRLLGRVSELLSTVTGGRAKVGLLNYVDNIKDADLVVSLTGAPASPGFANLQAIEGRPGQIVLYYQTLEPLITQDVVFTTVHEMSHYIFGLADEYDQSNFPSGCPVRQGPGCLMDNYYASARGFMGRYCNQADHNHEPRQQMSCQEIVDDFFSKLGVTAGAEAGDAGTVATTTNPPVDPRTTVIASAIGQVRAEKQQKLDDGKSSVNLSGIARKVLKDLITAFNNKNTDKFLPTGSQLSQLVSQVATAGQVVPTEKPADVERSTFAKILGEAKRLGQLYQDIKSQTTRAGRIRTALSGFLRELVRAGEIDGKAFGPPAQTALARQLADNAAVNPDLATLERINSLTNVTAELDLAIAEDLVAALDQLEVPGTPARLDYLARIRSRLTKDFGIPGRTFSRFGTRRTRIIAPDAGEVDKYVLTQAGVFPYGGIRDRSVVDFSRLINGSGMNDRSGKIELVSPLVTNPGLDRSALAARISRPFGEAPPEDLGAGASAKVNIQNVLTDTMDELQRNRLENVAILIPPAGLGFDLGAQVPVIRSRLRPDVDVRLDLVLVGPAPIDTELRDLVIESGGSVLTATDIDEIGAIAQRLKNEQTSGNWVVIPQQGTFKADPISDTKDAKPAKASVLVVPTAPVATSSPAATPPILPIVVPELVVGPKTLGREKVDPAFQEVWDRLVNVQPIQEGDQRSPGRVRQSRPLRDLAEAILKEFQAKKDGQPQQVRASMDRAIGAAQVLIAQLDVLRNLRDMMARDLDEAAGPHPNQPAEVPWSALRSKWTMPDVGVNVRLLRSLGPAREAANTLLNVHRDFKREILLGNVHGFSDDFLKRVRLQIGEPDFRPAVIQNFENLLKAVMVATGDNLPIYERLDRQKLEVIRRNSEEFSKRQAHPGAAPPELPIDKSRSIRLARFYAEGNAEFELIVGLSAELKPRAGVDTAGRFRMRLLSDIGAELGESAKLRFDTNTSTPSLLVFRAASPPLEGLWYTPVLEFTDINDFNDLQNAGANFTFSVGSGRQNIQLITNLVQPRGVDNKGTIFRAQQYAMVEVQVAAPSSVVDANIAVFYQVLDRSSNQIITRQIQTIRDDGLDVNGRKKGSPDFGKIEAEADESKAIYFDRQADDGIYTVFVPLSDVKSEAEFRVFVQADTTDGGAHYIQLDDPQRDDGDDDTERRKPADKGERQKQELDTKRAEGEVLKFQRATSVHFRVIPG